MWRGHEAFSQAPHTDKSAFQSSRVVGYDHIGNSSLENKYNHINGACYLTNYLVNDCLSKFWVKTSQPATTEIFPFHCN